MHYDNEVENIENLLETYHLTNNGAQLVLMGGIVDALYNIANELHEINKNVRAGVDDGR